MKVFKALGIASVTAAFISCSPSANKSAGEVPAGNIETPSFNPTVVTALQEVPAARAYVDPQNGYFDYKTARNILGAVDARSLRLEWQDALREARIIAD